MRSVRKGDWKLIKYGSPRDGVQATQLFNLASNPHEFVQEHHDAKLTALVGASREEDQTNLAGDALYAKKLAEMEELLLAEMRRHDDPYRLWDQPDDGLEPPKLRKPKEQKRKRAAKNEQ